MSEPEPITLKLGERSEWTIPIIFKLGEPSDWTLPEIEESLFSPVSVKFFPDDQIAKFLTFDSSSRTITFDGGNVKSGEKLTTD